jgi:DNA-binding CsgD family transcriptional regulator
MTSAFTSREVEIIRLICEGNFSDKELAHRLNISPETASSHLRNIFNKLREQLRQEEITRMDVVIYAILAGYADTGKLRLKYAIPDERMAAAAPL